MDTPHSVDFSATQQLCRSVSAKVFSSENSLSVLQSLHRRLSLLKALGAVAVVCCALSAYSGTAPVPSVFTEEGAPRKSTKGSKEVLSGPACVMCFGP